MLRFKDCSSHSHDDTPRNKSRNSKVFLQMQPIKALKEPSETIPLTSLEEPRKQYLQLFENLDQLMNNPLIDGFNGMNLQQIRDKHKRLKDNVQDSDPGNSRRKETLDKYRHSVSELEKFCKDLETYIGKRPKIDDQSDKTQANNLARRKISGVERPAENTSEKSFVSSQKSGADQLVNPEQKPHDKSSSANLPQIIEKIQSFTGGDWAYLRGLKEYIERRGTGNKAGQQSLPNRNEGIELSNRGDQPRVLSKEDIEKLRFQLERSCIRKSTEFTDSHSELNHFIQEVKKGITYAKDARKSIEEFSGDWQTVVSYAGNIIANSQPDGSNRAISEQGIINKKMLIDNANKRITLAEQGLEQIERLQKNGELDDVSKSSQILMSHRANLSEIQRAMREINPPQKGSRQTPTYERPLYQKALMYAIGTPLSELRKQPKELTPQQKMEEQKFIGLVNDQSMVHYMIDMCKHNINRIVGYWDKNFDSIHQSTRINPNHIFNEIKKIKKDLKKIEEYMENFKMINYKPGAFKISKGDLLKKAKLLSEKNKQLSDIWAKLHEQDSGRLPDHALKKNLNLEISNIISQSHLQEEGLTTHFTEDKHDQTSRLFEERTKEITGEFKKLLNHYQLFKYYKEQCEKTAQVVFPDQLKRNEHTASQYMVEKLDKFYLQLTQELDKLVSNPTIHAAKYGISIKALYSDLKLDIEKLRRAIVPKRRGLVRNKMLPCIYGKAQQNRERTSISIKSIDEYMKKIDKIRELWIYCINTDTRSMQKEDRTKINQNHDSHEIAGASTSKAREKIAVPQTTELSSTSKASQASTSSPLPELSSTDRPNLTHGEIVIHQPTDSSSSIPQTRENQRPSEMTPLEIVIHQPTDSSSSIPQTRENQRPSEMTPLEIVIHQPTDTSAAPIPQTREGQTLTQFIPPKVMSMESRENQTAENTSENHSISPDFKSPQEFLQSLWQTSQNLQGSLNNLSTAWTTDRLRFPLLSSD